MFSAFAVAGRKAESQRQADGGRDGGMRDGRYHVPAGILGG